MTKNAHRFVAMGVVSIALGATLAWAGGGKTKQQTGQTGHPDQTHQDQMHQEQMGQGQMGQGQMGQGQMGQGQMGQDQGTGVKAAPLKGVKSATMTDRLQGWPAEAQRAAEVIFAKYGEPAQVTTDRVVWENTGSYKKTVVLKDAVDHDFPIPHKGVLEQTIDYRVPADKFDDIAQFSGSIVPDRNRGELTARFDSEELNTLAINLADQVATGKKSWRAAREQFGDQVAMVLRGEAPREANLLVVDVTRRDTLDRDKPAPQAMRAAPPTQTPQPIAPPIE